MIKAEQVPHAVKDAFYNAYWREDATDEEAIAAAINAWPGMKLEHLSSWVMDGPDLHYVEEVASIILPLTQESGNE